MYNTALSNALYRRIMKNSIEFRGTYRYRWTDGFSFSGRSGHRQQQRCERCRGSPQPGMTFLGRLLGMGSALIFGQRWRLHSLSGEPAGNHQGTGVAPNTVHSDEHHIDECICAKDCNKKLIVIFIHVLLKWSL